MLLNQVFDKFEHVKIVFVRKNGKLKKVCRTIVHDIENKTDTKDTLFPISKERS